MCYDHGIESLPEPEWIQETMRKLEGVMFDTGHRQPWFGAAPRPVVFTEAQRRMMERECDA